MKETIISLEELKAVIYKLNQEGKVSRMVMERPEEVLNIVNELPLTQITDYTK